MNEEQREDDEVIVGILIGLVGAPWLFIGIVELIRWMSTNFKTQ